MSNNDLLTSEFPVKLPDGTVLRVQALSVEGESRILRELGRLLHESYGPGGFVSNCKGMLDYMLANGMREAYSQAVSELTKLTATRTRPGLDAVFEYRETPEGLARELFLRTRETHPQLAEMLIRSQLNDVSAWQVAAQLFDGLAADRKSRSAGAGGVAAE